MSLINCPECGKEISDKSEKCINCGYPLVKIEVVKCRWCATLNKEIFHDINEPCPECGFDEQKYRTNAEAIEKGIPIPSQNTKKCPKCGSSEFTPVRKKWSPLTGFLTNKVDLICNKCGSTVK